MCGIIVVLNAEGDVLKTRRKVVSLASKIRHRGPDWSGIEVRGQHVFAHERLAIVNIDSGAQPLVHPDDSDYVLVIDGEIYNHQELQTIDQPRSDCDVVLHMYKKYGSKFVSQLNGSYAFVATDGKSFMVARDPIGNVPLYKGIAKDGSLWFASEMKVLIDDCETIELFPPGHYYTPEEGMVQFYKPKWFDEEYIPDTPIDYQLLRTTFEKAVTRRLMCDVPYGVLLSGGLDSSLVASIVTRYSSKRVEDQGKSKSWWPRVHSFSVGLKGESPDLEAAKKVAEYLGTIHHEFTFTVQDGLDAIESMIWHLETYDVTTIRASTPMYLLSRKIKALGIKMVLSGEGSDEIFGGYLYFGNAPNESEFHKETVRRVKTLHTADCLRADKSTSAWGLGVRVPFLDTDFVDLVMNIDPKEKMFGDGKIEKYILRKAFDDKEDPYLPHEVLWRQKEQFSDGVGYSWIDTLIETATKEITDEEYEFQSSLYLKDKPISKEALYYRRIFDRLFPHEDASKTVMTWIPTWGKSKDPSGRAQQVHENHSIDI